MHLVRNRERVVSKDDLIEAVWHGRVVSESTLTSRINAVRKAVGDSGEAQRLIRTVQRKGIRFVGAVSEAIAAGRGGGRRQDGAIAGPCPAARDSFLHRVRRGAHRLCRSRQPGRRWSRRPTGSIIWNTIGRARSGAICCTSSRPRTG